MPSRGGGGGGGIRGGGDRGGEGVLVVVEGDVMKEDSDEGNSK